MTCVSQKNDDIFLTLIRLRFQGTVVNRALTSLHGGSLKNTLSVPLKAIKKHVVLVFFRFKSAKKKILRIIENREYE